MGALGHALPFGQGVAPFFNSVFLFSVPAPCLPLCLGGEPNLLSTPHSQLSLIYLTNKNCFEFTSDHKRSS